MKTSSSYSSASPSHSIGEKESDLWNWQASFWKKNNDRFDLLEKDVAKIGDPGTIFCLYIALLSKFYSNYLRTYQKEFDAFNEEWHMRSLHLLAFYLNPNHWFTKP